MLLVGDQGVARAGLLEGIFDTAIIWHDLEGEPKATTVNEVSELAQDCATVVGVGGGSAMDLAKMAALPVFEKGIEYYALDRRPLPPPQAQLVLVPTTAGTGSEWTRTGVFTDSEGRKSWVWGEELRAELSVFDAELTERLPHDLTLYCALDALAHGVEASTAPSAPYLPRSVARLAAGEILRHLPRVLEQPDDLESRQALLHASAFAGYAIDCCGTGLAHALAHSLGTLTGMPHGQAVALGMRVALKWNKPETYGELPSVENIYEKYPVEPPPELNLADLVEVLGGEENAPMLANNARPVKPYQYQAIAELLWR